MYIDGTLYYDRSTEDARVADRASKKAALVQAEKDAAAKDKKDDKKDDDKPEAPEVPPTTAGTNGTNGHGTNPTPMANQQRLENLKRPANLTAIINARIHPITSASIERGTIVLKAGRIEALGADVAVPAGAQVIDAAGADVYPGFIDASTTLGLDEPGPRGFADTAESVEYNPHLRTRTAYHPDSEAIPVARANGVTTVGVAPGGGVLAGEVAVMQLDGWTWEEATLRPSAGISFQFPPINPAKALRRGRRSRQDVRRPEEGSATARSTRLPTCWHGPARTRARRLRPARSTGCWRRWCRWSRASCRWSSPPTARPTSATPSASARARTRRPGHRGRRRGATRRRAA